MNNKHSIVYKARTDSSIKSSLLPAIFIVKDFVKGSINYDYEEYLIELINSSIYFRQKSDFKEYGAPLSEAHGESDCISDLYSIDFKLVESTTRIHAVRELSNQIIKLQSGMGTCYPRRPNDSMSANVLHVALRQYTSDQLKVLSGKKKFKYNSVEYDVHKYAKMLKKEKNLFLFIPREFFVDDTYNFRYAIEIISKAIKADFLESIKYRETVSSGYDTYISFIYDDNLVIYEFINGNYLKFIDVFYLFKSKIYSELYFRAYI